MLTRFWFNRLSVERRVKFLQKRGIVLGTRLKNSRVIHMYMFRSVFAEIIFVNDDPHGDIESFSTVNGLDELSKKLENEIRARK